MIKRIDMVGGKMDVVTLAKIKIFYSDLMGQKSFSISIGSKARRYVLDVEKGRYKGIQLYKECYNCDIWSIGEIKER